MRTWRKGLVSITQPKLSQFTNMQTRHWCFTLNNWTADHDDFLKELGPEVSYLVYGYETGANGTPHLQGYIQFPRVKRFNEAQSLLPEGAHIEAKRGTPLQASDYCKKDGLYQEFGQLPSSGTVPQFEAFSSWVRSHHGDTGRRPSEREIAIEYPSLYVRYRQNLLSLVGHLVPHAQLERGEQYEWQRELEEIILSEPDDRTVLFYVDPAGGNGKTWFQRRFLTRFPDRTQILSSGKRDDIAHAIDETKDVFFFNIPRGSMENLQYSVLEQLKDRMVFSPKYCSKTKIFERQPHVVVFCNEHPDMEKMTPDRYFIKEF